MALTHREVLQLGLLLLCVPAQYLLSGNIGAGMGRSQAVLHLVSNLRHLRDSWFQVEPWKNRWFQFVSWVLRVTLRPTDFTTRSRNSSPETSLAIEVLQFRERAGYFATSLRTRTERPAHLRFRVGQVVRHRTMGYRAVIVGWDLQAKAPEAWLDEMYGNSKVLRNWPHYALLIDKRDRKPNHTTYIVQEQLELMKNSEVEHPDIEDKFAYFDGAQYIPQPKLRGLYPKD